MKKLFFALLVVLFATSVVAQTEMGKSCDNPIPVNKNYVGTITEPGEYWFTAWSYDLPLNVHFTPESDNSKFSPEVYVDFTCTPGVYEDHKLDSVINGFTDFGLELPVEFLCDRVTSNGKVEWDLSINENYRENLTTCGITHNVQAFVRVYFSEAGRISLQPDTTYQSCMENSEYVNLGDTFDIVANDVERVFVLPYSEWKKDSIQFTWIGDKSATVWVSDGACDFTPVSTSMYVKARYTTSAEAPYKLQSDDIESAVKNWLGGGVFFAKVVANGNGKLVVEKIPLGSIQGDAVLLQYGKSVELQANDERVFCFPKTWKGTEFGISTDFLMNMYVANTAEFEASSEDTNVFATYAFSKYGKNRKLQLSFADISTLATYASDDYLYVRFQCNKATVLTPSLWNASSCGNNSILLQSDTKRTIKAKSSSVVYRLNFADWVGYDFTIKWSGYSTLPTYISDVCDYTLSSSNSAVLKYKSIKARGSYTYTETDTKGWELRVDADGFVYIRFNPTNAGDMTIISSKPAEEDPIILTNECVESSIKLNVGDELVLNLDSAFTVYCINYAELVNKNVTFRWSGEESLHTFIAETCQFAVAPYNKYVVNYIAIPTNGELVLDAETLAKFADKVDDAGYLYVRFLTEKQGTITVQ